MTKLAKCLAIFAVGASFAFLGFAWVSLIGGPNWDAEAASLPEYNIQKDEGPEGKWNVKDRVSGRAVTVAAGNVQAAALIAARRDLKEQQDAEIAKLEAETATYKKKAAEVQKQNQADVKALAARVEELKGQLQALHAKILALSNEVVNRSQDSQKLRTEATKRREDVFRLSRELDEIRADNFRADELQKTLRDQLIRVQGALLALESRNKQLRDEGELGPAAGPPKNVQ